MPSRHTLRALVAALVVMLPGAAMAQQSPGQLQEVDDEDTTLTYRDMTGDDLDDMDVVNGAGEKVGEIDEVLADAGNQIVAVIVDLDDGALDLDDREVVMTLDSSSPSRATPPRSSRLCRWMS